MKLFSTVAEPSYIPSNVWGIRFQFLHNLMNTYFPFYVL